MWRRTLRTERVVLFASGPFYLAMAFYNSASAFAETMNDALAKAYLSNPNINQQRAGFRATDENVPKAVPGYLPAVNGEVDAGLSGIRSNLNPFNTNTRPRGAGVTVQQTLWNGNRTENDPITPPKTRPPTSSRCRERQKSR